MPVPRRAGRRARRRRVDAKRFDTLTRAFAVASVRTVIKARAGAAAGGLLTAFGRGESAAQNDKDKQKDGVWKRKCKKHSDCPLGAQCVNNHCGCPPPTVRCFPDDPIFEKCVVL